ncbi:MAG: hypothetical protein ABIA78_04580 [archaeon]
MRKTLIIFVFVLSLSLVFAMDYPHAFHGTVKYTNGESIPNGYIVTGKIGGEVRGSCVASDGKYDLIVTGPGGEVKFYIQGEETEESYDFEVFEITELDLIVESAPEVFEGCGDEVCSETEDCSTCSFDCGICPCGNDICAGDETCSTCPTDCGECVVNNGGNNNGGSPSSGGNSPSSSTTSISTLEDIETDEVLLNKQNNELQDLNEILNIDKLNEMSEDRSGITGAVVGFVKTKIGIGIIAGSLIVGIAGVVFVLRRK